MFFGTNIMIIVLGMIIGDSLLLVSGFHSLAKDCRWDITVTSTDSPLQEESVVENINTHFDITERVSDYMYDVKNIILKPTTGYLGYTYFLSIKLKCDNDAEGKQALEIALSISQPKVIMTYWGELMFGRNEGVVQFEMFGALADISAISGVDCGTVICHPTWLVPLPVDRKTLIIDIKVTADGIRQTIQSETIVPMDGFKFEAATRSVSNVLGLQKPLQALDSFSWTNILQLKFLPKASPVIVVGGFQNDHILYAEKEFNEISVLQLTILASLSGPDVCSAGASIVYNTASLQDRILLSTQQGLVEIFGNYRHLQEALVSAHVPQVVLSRCVAGIVLPTQFLLREKHLLIRTVDSVFASRLTEGVRLSFTELKNEYTLNTVCAGRGNTCSVVDAAPLPVGGCNFLILLSLDSFYQLVLFEGNNSTSGVFSTLTNISRDVSLLHPAEINTFHSEVIAGSLYLKGLTFPAFITSHVYIWGSKLLHSDDAGASVHMVAEYNSNSNISYFTTSVDGQFAFLTDNGELWYGLVAKTQIKKLNPSGGWYIYHWFNQDLSHGNSLTYSTVSIFFDYHNRLNQLLATINGSNLNSLEKHVVELGGIISLESDMLNFYPQKAQISGAQSCSPTSPESVHFIKKCPFFKLWFDTEPRFYHSGKQVFEFGTPRLSYYMKKYKIDGLLTYQAIAHDLINMDLNDKKIYLDEYTDRVSKWRGRITYQGYNDYLYDNHLLKHEIEINLMDYWKVFNTSWIEQPDLPEIVFLDRLEDFSFNVVIQMESVYSQGIKSLDDIQVSFSISRSDILRVDSIRHVHNLNESISYEASVSSSGNLQIQDKPGVNLYPVSLIMSVWDSALDCKDPTKSNSKPLGLYITNVVLGCPPTYKLKFDVSATSAKLAEFHEVPYDCVYPDEDFPCVYYTNSFNPYFMVIDTATGISWRYTGNYTFTVIGGSYYGRENIEMYTDDQIQKYNNQTKESANNWLVWGPMVEGEGDSTHWHIFDHTRNGINWLCMRSSSCMADMPIPFPHAPEVTYLVEVSNKGVNKGTTYCDFTVRFILRIHGLPIDTYYVAVPLFVITTALCIGHLLLFYVCLRKDEELWTWIKAFVKNLFRKKDEEDDEDEDDIMMGSEVNLQELLKDADQNWVWRKKTDDWSKDPLNDKNGDDDDESLSEEDSDDKSEDNQRNGDDNMGWEIIPPVEETTKRDYDNQPRLRKQ